MIKSVFDYVKSINDLDKNINDFSQYNSYLINRALSYFKDTILYVSELNQYQNIPDKAEYLFLINSLSKKKRFSKWAKVEVSDTIVAIQKYYGYSIDKARSALKLLSEEQIEDIKKTIKGIENG